MNKFAEFIIVYGQGLYHPSDYARLWHVYNKHKEFNTLTILTDWKGIYAVARWNIDDTVAHVLDVVIRPDRRNPKTIKQLIKASRDKFLYLTHIRYERVLKKNNRMRLKKLDKLKEK